MGWPGLYFATWRRAASSAAPSSVRWFTVTAPVRATLRMISPGTRVEDWPERAVGNVSPTSYSHCEKTELVTKKHSKRNTTSIIAVIWNCGSAARLVRNSIAAHSRACLLPSTATNSAHTLSSRLTRRPARRRK